MRMQSELVLLLLSVFGNCISGFQNNPPVVKTEHGLIKGEYLKSRKDSRFCSFRGIPYAKPPLGELRFRAPEPASPWDSVLDATRSSNVCPQRRIYTNSTLMGNENCLYLNVYTPQVLTNFTTLLPVMVFIHGGALKYGSGNYEHQGPELLMDKGVVLVTFNYRLGALGFLSTADDVVSGNNGLKDQTLALRWIKNNIETFGGDSNRVTLFGQSSGAMNAQLHIMSPLSKDLIHNVISQSGTACSMVIVLEGDARATNARKLAKSLNCTTSSSSEMVECLRRVPALDIVEQQEKLVVWNRMPIRIFIPVVEPNITGAFLTHHPVDAYKEGLVAKIPYMTGINTDEGAFHAAGVFGDPHLVKKLNEDFDRIAPATLGFKGLTDNEDYVSRNIKEFYFQNQTIDISSQSKSSVTKMYTDSWRITMGIDNSAILHSKYASKAVYYYLFGYRASSSYTEVMGDPTHNYGVCHCDELLHLFKLDLPPNYTPSSTDEETSELLLTLWTNFAKTGNPNLPRDKALLEEWIPFNTAERAKIFYIRNASNVSMIEEPFPSRYRFWNELPINGKGYLNKI